MWWCSNQVFSQSYQGNLLSHHIWVDHFKQMNTTTHFTLIIRQLTTAWQHISTRSNGWIHQWISYKQGTLSQVPSHFKIFFKSSVLLAKYYSIKEVSTPAKLLSLKLEAHKPFKVYISTLVWYRKSTIFPVLHQYLLASIVKVTFKTSYRYYLTLDVFCYFASCWIQWYLESIKPNC